MLNAFEVVSERNSVNEDKRLFCLQFENPIEYKSEEELTQKLKAFIPYIGDYSRLFRCPQFVEKVNECTYWVELRDLSPYLD